MSHYLQAVRIACFDESGQTARIADVSSGAELQAARCSLGCLGVVVEVTLPCIPQYFVEEQMVRCDSIEDAIAMEATTPLQQFFPHPAFMGLVRAATASGSRNETAAEQPCFASTGF